MDTRMRERMLVTLRQPRCGEVLASGKPSPISELKINGDVL
jgi:hypothetical protein